MGTYGDGAYLRSDRLDLLGVGQLFNPAGCRRPHRLFHCNGALTDEAREDYSIYLHPDSTLGSLWGEIFDWTEKGHHILSRRTTPCKAADPWQQLYTHTFDNAQAWDTYGAKGECTLTFYWLDNYSSRYDWYRVDSRLHQREINSDDLHPDRDRHRALCPGACTPSWGVSSTTGDSPKVYSNGRHQLPGGALWANRPDTSINTYALGASLFNYTAAGDPRYTRSFTVRDVIYNQSNVSLESRSPSRPIPRQPNFSNWPPSIYRHPARRLRTGFSNSRPLI